MNRFKFVAVATAMCFSSAVFAQDLSLEVRTDGLRYSDVVESKLQVDKVAIAALNFKAGVHLERLTLLSGEGNTDKKITAGLLAGAATLLGAGGAGSDWASREPIEEHLPVADAQKIGDDIANMIAAAVVQTGLGLVDPKEVVALPAYANIKGESKPTTDTENIKGGMFKASYFFGYHRLPISGYKYRERGMFDMASDDFSKPLREATGVPVVLAWNINVVNDRKVMRVRELNLLVMGKTGSRDSALMTLTVKPDTLSVDSGESHKNLDYWAALSPKVNTAVQTMLVRVAETLKTTK